MDYWGEPNHVRVLERELKKYDDKLIVRTNRKGVRIIYEVRKKVDWFELDGHKIGHLTDNPQIVFCLTDTWTIHGKPVDWGLLPILDKLRFSDMALNTSLMEDLEKQDEEMEESKKRDMRNQTEAFLYDFRSQFKKTFSDINVSSLDKTDKRRKKTKKEL